MVSDQNFHNIGKYLEKLLDGWLQLDFLAECRKGSLTTLAWVYKLPVMWLQTNYFGKKGEKKAATWMKKKQL